MEEKRRFNRLTQEMPVKQRPENSNDIELTQARNISTGGLRIATDSELNVGSKIDIEVNISGSSKPYYALGEVVWLKEMAENDDKKFDMGVKFLRIMTKKDGEEF